MSSTVRIHSTEAYPSIPMDVVFRKARGSRGPSVRVTTGPNQDLIIYPPHGADPYLEIGPAKASISQWRQLFDVLLAQGSQGVDLETAVFFSAWYPEWVAHMDKMVPAVRFCPTRNFDPDAPTMALIHAAGHLFGSEEGDGCSRCLALLQHAIETERQLLEFYGHQQRGTLPAASEGSAPRSTWEQSVEFKKAYPEWADQQTAVLGAAGACPSRDHAPFSSDAPLMEAAEHVFGTDGNAGCERCRKKVEISKQRLEDR